MLKYAIHTEKNSLTIGFGGDAMLGRGVNAKISTTYASYPWGNVLPLLKKNDVNILNLETTLTKSNKKVLKYFNFKADPDTVKTLEEAKIDIVTLANNHILDFSEEGLIETLEVLDKACIKHTGAGRNAEEAAKATILTKNNITMGVLGYTDNEPDWKATDRPGTNYITVGDIDRVHSDIEQIKNKTDILIISIHWGPNMRERPTQKFITFAHQMMDAGADIIHGHSAHIFQGIELYKNGLILYDTGDFVDDYVVDSYLRNDRSFLFLCEVDPKKVKSLRLIPLLIKNRQVNIAKGEDYAGCMQRMQQLSAAFGTKITDDGYLTM